MDILLFILFSGYLLSYLLFPKREDERMERIVSAFPVGMIFGVSVFYFNHYQYNPNLFIYLFDAAFVIYVAFRFYRKRMWRYVFARPPKYLFILGGYLFLRELVYLKYWISDYKYHGINVAQFIHGQFPPLSYFPRNTELQYHYGFDGILAELSADWNISYTYVSSLLLALFTASIFLEICLWCRRRHWNGFETSFLVILFFEGSGYRFFSYLFDLSSFTDVRVGMLGQPAWSFTVSLLMILLLSLEKNKKNLEWKDYLFIILLGLFAPVYSATSIVLIGIYLGYCFLVNLTGKEFINAGKSMLAGICLLIFWGIADMGMLKQIPGYIKPHLSSIFLSFDMTVAIKYTLVYTAIIIPSLIVLTFAHSYLKTNKFAALNSSERFLFVLFPLTFIPYFAVFDNINLYDNYCKFNFIGIQASFFLLVMMYRYFKTNKVVKYIFLFFALISVQGLRNTISTDYLAARHPFQEHMAYDNTLRKYHNLLQLCEQKLSYDTPILVLNDNLSCYRMNPDKKWETSEVFTIPYSVSSFDCISTDLGIPIINNANYTYLYNPEKEDRLIDAYNRLSAGDFNAINDLCANYVLWDTDKSPRYINKLIMKNMIKHVKVDKKEKWALYQIVNPNHIY